MSNRNIIKAWKDPGYCNTLSQAERAALPPNPAGTIEISDEDLGKIAGGIKFTASCSAVCSNYCTDNCTHIFCTYDCTVSCTAGCP
jgi:mersacidin/lichenicidin family type 2 lantibiotic